MRMTGTVGDIAAMSGPQDVIEVRCGDDACGGALFRIHATGGRASVFCTDCGREAMALKVESNEARN